jgi:hypothetical protein
MQISNESGPWSPWETAVAGKAWQLSSGNGPKTVRVLLRDEAGNIGMIISPAITLEEGIYRVSSPASLQSFYNAAMDDSQLLLTTVASFVENLDCNRPVRVNIQGGWDAPYTNKSGLSNLVGSLIVSSGTVTVENLVII